MKKNNLKTAAMIFLTFFRIGCFTFGGGWAIVAQMEEQFVNKRKLITKDELLAIAAERGVQVDASNTKAEIIDALKKTAV